MRFPTASKGEDTMHRLDSRLDTSDFLAGLICGVAVGAALGVVLAPQAGADTRRQIGASGDRLRETATRAYGQVGEGVDSLVLHGRDAVNRGREAVERGREMLNSRRVSAEGGSEEL
jgi:gas vesicle protein